MDDPLLMSVLKGAEHLLDHGQDLARLHFALLEHIILQGNALDIFHHDIFRVRTDGNIVYGNDIGMRQHRDRL